jgi:hypothetical protein
VRVCFILGVWWSSSLLGVSLLSLVLVFNLEIWCSEGSELAHDGDEHRVLVLCNVRRIGALLVNNTVPITEKVESGSDGSEEGLRSDS